MLRLTLLALLTGFAITQSAYGQPQPYGQLQGERVSPPPARQRGTHRLLELSGGVTSLQDPQLAGGLIVGAGGRPAGTPLRVYFIAEMAYGKWLQPQGNRKPFDLRKHYSLNAGLRVYLPLVFGLRVFADASAGASYLHNDLRHQGRTFRAAGYTPSAALAAGLQLRVIESLALGARAKWWFAEDPLADLHKQLGAHERIPFSATGSVTWHF